MVRHKEKNIDNFLKRKGSSTRSNVICSNVYIEYKRNI